MSPTRTLVISAIAISFFVGCTYGGYVIGLSGGNSEAASRKDVSDIAQYIDSINNAKTAKQAIDAYGQGLEIDQTDLDLQRAYMRKTVELERLDLAEKPAKFLVIADPEPADAWAVLAFRHAEDGEFEAGLKAVIRASKDLSDNRDVQRLAGQLFAWYDNTDQKPELSGELQDSLIDARKKIDGKDDFKKAYEEVTEAFKDSPKPSDEEIITADTEDEEPEGETGFVTKIIEYRSYPVYVSGFYYPYFYGYHYAPYRYYGHRHYGYHRYYGHRRRYGHYGSSFKNHLLHRRGRGLGRIHDKRHYLRGFGGRRRHNFLGSNRGTRFSARLRKGTNKNRRSIFTRSRINNLPSRRLNPGHMTIRNPRARLGRMRNTIQGRAGRLGGRRLGGGRLGGGRLGAGQGGGRSGGTRGGGRSGGMRGGARGGGGRR